MPVFSEKFTKLVRAHGVEVVFTKPVSLQSELCNLNPPRDRLQRKDVVYEKVDCGECGVSYIGETAQRLTDRAKQHQYSVRTEENDNNSFFFHAAHHHGVGGEEERGTGVELFKRNEAQFLDADRPFTPMPTRPSRELA